MSVLIKGMDMPETCRECYFRDWYILGNMYVCDCPACEIEDANISREVEAGCRHPNCPLTDAEGEKNDKNRPV